MTRLPLAMSVLGVLIPLHATPMLTFSGIQYSGEVSYAGGNAPLQGVVDLTSNSVLQYPFDPGRYLLGAFGLPTSGIGWGPGLQYSTGPLVGYDATTWLFGAGGSMSLTAAVYQLDDNGELNLVLPFATLFSGTSLGATLSDVPYSAIAPVSLFRTDGVFLGSLDPAFASLFGLPGGLYRGEIDTFSASASSVSAPSGVFAGGVRSFTMTLDPASQTLAAPEIVPEPAPVLLLGTALVLFCFHQRKNLLKSVPYAIHAGRARDRAVHRYDQARGSHHR